VSKTYLKIKIMSLAAEARIIRREESKARAAWRHNRSNTAAEQDFWGLRSHRTWNVRNEARVALLAYGYLRGRTYRQLEFNPGSEPDWARVVQLAARYGKPTTRDDIKAWAEAAEPVAIAA